MRFRLDVIFVSCLRNTFHNFSRFYYTVVELKRDPHVPFESLQ